jgi:hypothetical protein
VRLSETKKTGNEAEREPGREVRRIQYCHIYILLVYCYPHLRLAFN